MLVLIDGSLWDSASVSAGFFGTCDIVALRGSFCDENWGTCLMDSRPSDYIATYMYCITVRQQMMMMCLIQSSSTAIH
jgi:hypothetical protein